MVIPEGVDRALPLRPIYLDIHGGSLLMGGGQACEVMARRAAAQVQMQTWSVDYRMPPDHPYPAGSMTSSLRTAGFSKFGLPSRSWSVEVRQVATWPLL